jgi:hypothetical protein
MSHTVPTASTISITSSNGTHFAFNSVVVASAWRDNLQWNLYASIGGSFIYYGGLTLPVINQTIVTCTGCTDFDVMYFATSGGTPHPGLAENGTQFAFDNLCISFGY